MNPQDNVVVLSQAAVSGDVVTCGDSGPYVVKEAIPTGHKLSTCDIPAGGPIIKYGLTIGRASCDITQGIWVHSHNVTDITEELCDSYAAAYRVGEEEPY